ncbi:LacI family DNA-binding transcriptional regulator [Blastococcus saxobsidens]|uniref:Transcriptional regulator, LacI family n=1 Tax=Blastococcus saxobsidens (strain DD2) TaxID=1146883 RepID=H6RPF8_BLASD|nr:LacI family DNA-binding transcriptional regulator [Blastococcus saxobsidens]CCG04017.1 Transcriptional regulator, LacI family [Blastococcus saxobsidens DD2]
MRERVTLRDVARIAAVSAKTVSRVVNGDAHVTPGTRARVQQAIADLGFQPNLVARSLRVGRTDVVGLVVESLADPFFARLTSAVEQAAHERGLAVMVSSVGNQEPERESVIVESLLVRQVAGLIVAPMAQSHTYLAGAGRRTPIVFVDRLPEGIVSDAVLVDDLAAGEMATRHLLDHGHRRVAFLGSELRNPTTRLRLAGYRRALAARGLADGGSLVAVDAGSAREARAAAEQLLAGPRPPTAIFSSNMRCSLGLVPLLHGLGRTDVAVVSFDDFPMADSLVPAVTVIDHDPEVIGRAAAERLFRRLDDLDAPAETVTVPVRLVPRGSGELPPAGSGRRRPHDQDVVLAQDGLQDMVRHGAEGRASTMTSLHAQEGPP